VSELLQKACDINDLKERFAEACKIIKNLACRNDCTCGHCLEAIDFLNVTYRCY